MFQWLNRLLCDHAYQWLQTDRRLLGRMPDPSVVDVQVWECKHCGKRRYQVDDVLEGSTKTPAGGFPGRESSIHTALVNQQIEHLTHTDNVSDGVHTFGELKDQRVVLLAAFASVHPKHCWKARDEEDPNTFMVGMETPVGTLTGQVSSRYWTHFQIESIDSLPKEGWDVWDNLGLLFTLSSTHPYRHTIDLDKLQSTPLDAGALYAVSVGDQIDSINSQGFPNRKDD